MFQSAAVPTRASGCGSGRLGAADPTPATQTAAFFGFRAVYPPRPPYQGGLHLESPRWPGWDVLTAAFLDQQGAGQSVSPILCFRHPQAQFRTQAHSYGRMARAKRGRPGHPLAQGPWRGQLRGQPWHGQPWKGQGEFFCIKNTFLFQISLSPYIYIYICQPWRGQPWRGPGGGDY